MDVHENNIPKVSADCMDALHELNEWSWNGYAQRLSAKGYKLHLRKDKSDVIHGYVVCKGNTRFKASELGKGRNLTASHIERTWEKLHPEQANQTNQTSKQPIVMKPNPAIYNEAETEHKPNVRQPNPIYEDYAEWKSDRLHTQFEHDGTDYDRYIPEKVLDYLNNEFDYRELVNWQDLQNLAIAYFTLVASPYGEVSGGGGGGSQSDLKWGRDPKEDEIEFAHRCAQEVSHKLGIQKKSGMKRR